MKLFLTSVSRSDSGQPEEVEDDGDLWWRAMAVAEGIDSSVVEVASRLQSSIEED